MNTHMEKKNFKGACVFENVTLTYCGLSPCSLTILKQHYSTVSNNCGAIQVVSVQLSFIAKRGTKLPRKACSILVLLGDTLAFWFCQFCCPLSKRCSKNFLSSLSHHNGNASLFRVPSTKLCCTYLTQTAPFSYCWSNTCTVHPCKSCVKGCVDLARGVFS